MLKPKTENGSIAPSVTSPKRINARETIRIVKALKARFLKLIFFFTSRIINRTARKTGVIIADAI